MSSKKSILIKHFQQLQGVENALILAISPESNDFMVVEIYFDPETVEDKLTPEEVQRRNYNATEKRGLINNKTTFVDFRDKLLEEIEELTFSWNSNKFINCGGEFDPKELADISIVCDSMAFHYGIDLQKEKELKMYVNEKRTY